MRPRSAQILLLALAAALPARAETLPLHLTFPPPDLAFYGSHVRVAGWTRPGASVELQGDPVQVYPTGAFVGLVELKLGENTLHVRAASGTLHAVVETTVRSLALAPVLPSRPTRIAAGSAYPSGELVLRGGDRVRFGFRASPGGTAELELGGRRVPMREHDNGRYAGQLRIEPGTVIARCRPVVHLRGRDGRRVSQTLAASVETRAATAPRVAFVSAFRTRLYRRPEGSGFIETLPKGARLRLGGRRGEWREIGLCGRHYWAPRADLAPATGVAATPTALGPLVVRQERDALRIVLPAGAPLGVRYRQPEPAVLRLDFDGVGALDAAVPAPGGLLRSARWLRTSWGARLELTLHRPPAWGYRLDYRPGRIELVLPRSPLRTPAGGKLSGLVVALDPGHGGYERGAESPTGKWEKDATLRWPSA